MKKCDFPVRYVKLPVDIYHTVYHCIPHPFLAAGGAVSGMERCAMPEAGSGAIGWGYNWN